ncbi:MAG: hypothetical protein MUF30_07145, partial [Burkholderiales bacterium]|nr:hypothetical protein [Burkholderiales bacterium]
MNRSPFLRRSIAVALMSASLAASSAWATITSAARLSPLRVQLFDLAPDDGVAPSIDWTSQRSTGNFSSVLGQADDLSTPAVAQVNLIGGTSRDSFTRTVTDGANFVTTSIDARGASIFGRNNVAGRHFMTVTGALADGGWYTLSPQTRLVISADAEISFSSDGHLFDNASGYVHLRTREADMTDPRVFGRRSQDLMDVEMRIRFTPPRGHGPRKVSDSRTLVLDLSNPDDLPFRGLLTIEMSAGAAFSLGDNGVVIDDPPQPVPEPASWMTALLGLAGASVVRRRR